MPGVVPLAGRVPVPGWVPVPVPVPVPVAGWGPLAGWGRRPGEVSPSSDASGPPVAGWIGMETVPAAEGSAVSSAVGGCPMCRGPGSRMAVVLSASGGAVPSPPELSAESSAEPASSPAGGNVSLGMTPVASGSKGTSDSSLSPRTSEEPVIPVCMPSPSRCLTLTIMKPRTTPG
ncbi:hypothetical protein HD597_012237 [Nonomuraea thailandensis]|uniref:Uncharacterized protein n=1 Tax=Nonomuraea thailandensis TaxID=1188745 RepID=A0A9X2GWP0_9ACTN|nr:hypothetical protein [Nonomuraea thailandensis]